MAIVLHSYTTNKEIPGWTSEGTTCHIYSTPHDGALALHHWVYVIQGNHYYTTNTASMPEWSYERIEGYVFIKPRADVIRIYHWWHPGTGDNFYTADPGGELAPGSGYVNPGDPFYAFATPVSGTVPFNRFVYGTQLYCAKLWGPEGIDGRKSLGKQTVEAATHAEALQLADEFADDYKRRTGVKADLIEADLGGC